MWTFKQSTGQLFQDDEFIASGYSGGNCGKNPDWVNNPDSQENHGATIPQGIYTAGEALDHSILGAFAIPLIPDPSNNMYNRSGFYMHGDTSACNQSASEGCLIFPPSIRHEYYNSADTTLKVIP